MKSELIIKPYYLYPFVKSWRTTYLIDSHRVRIKTKWGKGSDTAFLKDADFIPDSRFKLFKKFIKFGNLEIVGQNGKSTILRNLANIEEVQRTLEKIALGQTIEQITMSDSDRKSEERKRKLNNTQFSDKVVIVPSIPKQFDRPIWLHIGQIKHFPTKYFTVGDWIEKGDIISIFTDWFIDHNLSIRSPISGRLICYHDPFLGSENNGFIVIQPEDGFTLDTSFNPYTDFAKLLRQPKIYEHYFRNSKLRNPSRDWYNDIKELESRQCFIEDGKIYEDTIKGLNQSMKSKI